MFTFVLAKRRAVSCHRKLEPSCCWCDRCKMEKQKRFHYEVSFKQKVIILAGKEGNQAASRSLGIPETCVQDWRNYPPLRTSSRPILSHLLQVTRSAALDSKRVGAGSPSSCGKKDFRCNERRAFVRSSRNLMKRSLSCSNVLWSSFDNIGTTW